MPVVYGALTPHCLVSITHCPISGLAESCSGMANRCRPKPPIGSQATDRERDGKGRTTDKTVRDIQHIRRAKKGAEYL